MDNFEIVAENPYLKLYLNPNTTEIAVQDKASKKLWFSNPPNRAEMETIARGSALDRISSQFSISYYTPGDRRRYKDNYSDSVEYEQFEISRTEKIAPRMANAHIKVNTYDSQGQADNVDVERLVSIFKDVGYDGHIVLEYFGQGDPRDSMTSGLKLLDEILS